MLRTNQVSVRREGAYAYLQDVIIPITGSLVSPPPTGGPATSDSMLGKPILGRSRRGKPALWPAIGYGAPPVISLSNVNVKNAQAWVRGVQVRGDDSVQSMDTAVANVIGGAPVVNLLTGTVYASVWLLSITRQAGPGLPVPITAVLATQEFVGIATNSIHRGDSQEASWGNLNPGITFGEYEEEGAIRLLLLSFDLMASARMINVQASGQLQITLAPFTRGLELQDDNSFCIVDDCDDFWDI